MTKVVIFHDNFLLSTNIRLIVHFCCPDCLHQKGANKLEEYVEALKLLHANPREDSFSLLSHARPCLLAVVAL